MIYTSKYITDCINGQYPEVTHAMVMNAIKSLSEKGLIETPVQVKSEYWFKESQFDDAQAVIFFFTHDSTKNRYADLTGATA